MTKVISQKANTHGNLHSSPALPYSVPINGKENMNRIDQLTEQVLELLPKLDHNHRCMVCGAKLECDPKDCIADENLVCFWCDGR